MLPSSSAPTRCRLKSAHDRRAPRRLSAPPPDAMPLWCWPLAGAQHSWGSSPLADARRPRAPPAAACLPPLCLAGKPAAPQPLTIDHDGSLGGRGLLAGGCRRRGSSGVWLESVRPAARPLFAWRLVGSDNWATGCRVGSALLSPVGCCCLCCARWWRPRLPGLLGGARTDDLCDRQAGKPLEPATAEPGRARSPGGGCASSSRLHSTG